MSALRELLGAATVADVPLARGDDLEGLVALFEELDRVLDRAGLTDQLAGLGEHLDHLRLGAAGSLARDAAVVARGPGRSSATRGTSASKRPSRARQARVGRSSSRHQVTSVRSPNVQIMAMPVPLSGSASSWARTGTSTPNTGVVTVVPNSGW